MLPKLQYITQGKNAEEHLRHLTEALEAGVKFVQLRMKNAPQDLYVKTAGEAKRRCEQFGALLVVNDEAEVAKATGAEALHLGLNDLPVDQARKITGSAMIGGTANTMEHVRQRQMEKVDYIGLGPFRFTATKEKLSPVLGLAGYRAIIGQMKKENIAIPVYAIGGIELGDVKDLKACGLHGIAVSGLLTGSGNKKELVNELNTILNHA